jgi:hypothetical protein
MSEVNLNFSVVPVQANLLVTTNDITFSPSGINLSLYTGGIGVPAGATGTLQYNAGGILGAISNVTSTGSSVSFANVANLKISGGTSGQALTTDGAGNLSFSTVTTAPGGSTTQLQYNNAGVFAGMPNVTFSAGNLRLGPVANVKMTGGTNGYVLQTDGTGNLSWVAGAGGNGAVGGSNTQVQYNKAGVFGGTSGFVFDETTNTLTITNIIGNGIGLTSLTGANVTGTVPSANTVTDAAQSNITSVGTLTSVTTSGNLSVSGTTTVQQAKEKTVISVSAPGASTNFDVLSGAINYYTANMTANVTLNVRGNSTTTFNSITSVGDSVTIAMATTCGASVFLVSTFRIDSVTITPKWVGNVAPSVGLLQSSGINAYTYTIIKTAANTYTVLGSYTGYK